jgi:hypothetical protein
MADIDICSIGAALEVTAVTSPTTVFIVSSSWQRVWFRPAQAIFELDENPGYAGWLDDQM